MQQLRSSEPSMATRQGGLRASLVSSLKSSLSWIRVHPWFGVAILANALFVFLPFYDSNNMALLIATASHFTNNSPPSVLGLWVAGPFVDMAYVPGYLSYVYSGYDLYWTYTTLKLIFFSLTLATAYSVRQAFLSRGEDLADLGALLVIANPAVFFVNYVWVNYDIVPIAFLVIGYVILRYHRVEDGTSLRAAFSTLLISISVFFYWFALALIPTLILYEKSGRERTRTTLLFVVWIAVFFTFDVFLLSGGLGTYVNALIGTKQALNRTQTIGLQYFVKLTTPVYLVYLLVLTIVVPFFLKYWRFSEAEVGFIVVILLVFSATFPLPDNYTFVFGFAIIVALETGRRSRAALYSLGLMAYPIVGIALFNLYIGNAEPDGVGVFYWGYDLFHLNIRIIDSYAEQAQFIRIFNIIVVIVVLLSIALILRLRSLRRGNPDLGTSSKEVLLSPRSAETISARGHPRREIGGVSAAIALLVVAGLVFNFGYPNVVTYDSGGTPPVFILTPIYWPSNGNIPRPIGNLTYSQDGNVLTIYPEAPPIAFGRWFEDQSVSFRANVAYSGLIPQSVPAVAGTPFSVTLMNLSQPGARSSSQLESPILQNVANVSLSYTLLNATNQGYLLSGNSTVSYVLNDSDLLNRYFVFAFNITKRGPLQTNVFHLQNSENFVALISYPDHTVLVYGGKTTNGSFVQVNVPTIVPAGVWNYVILSGNRTGFWVDVNGVTAAFSESLFGSGPNTLRIGVPFVPGGQNGYSLIGTVTGVYSDVARPRIAPLFVVVISAGVSRDFLPQPDSDFSIVLTASNSATSLTVGAHAFWSSTGIGSLYFGKLSRGCYAVGAQILMFSMSQPIDRGFYLVPVFVSFVLPYLVLGVGLTFAVSRYLPRKWSSPNLGPE